MAQIAIVIREVDFDSLNHSHSVRVHNAPTPGVRRSLLDPLYFSLHNQSLLLLSTVVAGSGCSTHSRCTRSANVMTPSHSCFSDL